MSMTYGLPDAFVRRMGKQLGKELPAFLRALDESAPRGIRLNGLKACAATESYTAAEPIRWAENAYYLDPDSKAGSTVLHEAGAFYIQEPSAMLPAAVLDAQPGEKIIDLCAAPGGKSTQIGCAMRGTGLLVCNEPVFRRAQILSRNIERFGFPNTVVTCAFSEQLAQRWEEGFDAVLVDAPCSGEGMFRRDPATRKEWTEEKAEGCARRQREILASAARLVRPGGRLVYSTCTYNPDENEGNAAWFLNAFPDFTAEAFSAPGISAPDGMYTCYPHQIKGEGQFTARFRKKGNGQAELPADHTLLRPAPNEAEMTEPLFPSFPYATHKIGNTLIHMPELPETKGIRILRAGLHLGEIKGKNIVPDHAAALCFRKPEAQSIQMSACEAVKYISGEALAGDMPGWTLMCFRDLVLGWGKGSDGMIKNHYPKGIRNPHMIPE